MEEQSTSWKNPAIAEGRAAALAALKPTDAQLEHGLELHRQALVIDAYGFSVFAVPDHARLLALQAAGASRQELAQQHLRSMMTRMADDPRQGELFAEGWRAAGVTCVLRNSGVEGNSLPHLLERLACNTYVADHMPDLMTRAVTPADIQCAKAEGRHCFYLTTNGVPLTTGDEDANQMMQHIELFFMLGVRMMHLTYNRRNLIGDGCAEPSDGGLSDFGRMVVGEMNRVGLIVDGAHSSLQTCRDMAAASSRPVVVSHSACATLNPHIRGKTDDVLKVVADTGGYTGIACVPAFLGGSGDINALLDHVQHAVRVVGAEHVAIGTDASVPLPDPQGPTLDLPPQRRAFENFWPAGDAIHSARWRQPHMGQSLRWTNYPLFTVGMVQRGLSDDQILAILGGNVLRVAQAVLARHGSECDH